MARVRMPKQRELAKWEDVDLTLAEIGELQRSMADIQTKMQEDIDAAKLAASVAVEPNQQRIKHLSEQLEMFADEHAADLGNKKTRIMTFGRLGYRKSTKVALPKDEDKLAEVIQRLKEKGMSACVVAPPETINKEAMKKYTAAEIAAVGAKLRVKDVFWYEVDTERPVCPEASIQC